jgi:hypothetical protein
MQTKLLSLVATFFIAAMSMSQGLKIGEGVVVNTAAGVNIVVQNGSLTNNGTGDLSNSNLYMKGSTSGNIDGNTATTVNNLYLEKGTAILSLGNDLSVRNNVVFQNGLLDLNGHNLLLYPAGLLVNESEANHITGPLGGTVSIIVDLNAPAGANPGNLGAIITCSKDMGRVNVHRGHNSQMNNASGKSILRWYLIEPTNNSSLGATFRFTYLDGELNGLDEGTLNMWKSTTGGNSWTKVNASGSSSTLNFIDATVNSFVRYTLSSSNFSLTNSNQYVSSADSRVNELNKLLSVTLVPNPVHLQGKVLINSGSAFNTELALFSSDGKRLMQQAVDLHQGINQATINTSSLAAGLYYLVVEMQDGTTRKISFLKE